ncbi:unnamed protein product [Meloidogyne enterolobii]|uniref:Uncharacterized protein n=1 Tax=Meloidogyne enterolobii TaxID=390850 RepID=A0ACB0XW70_MELEN
MFSIRSFLSSFVLRFCSTYYSPSTHLLPPAICLSCSFFKEFFVLWPSVTAVKPLLYLSIHSTDSRKFSISEINLLFYCQCLFIFLKVYRFSFKI